MTSTKLRTLVVSTLRALGPDDPIVQVFYAAFENRRVYATTFESEPDELGLQAALERAFVIYEPEEKLWYDEPRKITDRKFVHNLAVAASHIPLSVYNRFLKRLRRLEQVPTTQKDATEVLTKAMCAYSHGWKM